MQFILIALVFLRCFLGSTLAATCETCVCCDIGKEVCLANDSYCASCIDGYWGAKCREGCPTNCLACLKEPERDSTMQWQIRYHVCTKCVDGKYLGDTDQSRTCDLSCPSDCNTCTSFLNCTLCKTGYYLSNGKCLQCPSIGLCNVCNKGYYGDECDKSCSVGCDSGFCDKDSGTCSCKLGFKGTKCEQCADTFFGQYCQECSEACIEQICNRDNGYCEKCLSTNFTGNFCEKCIKGIYGNNCEMSCPINCRDRICNRTTGNCFQCASNFVGEKCNRCTPGKYGADCTLSCPTNCKDHRCTEDRGECISCPDGFNGPTCDQCTVGFFSKNCSLPCLSPNCYDNMCSRSSGLCEHNELCAEGWFGSSCDDSCSKGCRYGNCTREGGVCFEGCKDNYSGDKCCVQNKNCQYCLSATECSVCANGFYGEECQLKCSANCTGGCLKISGQCNGCIIDNFGTFCTGVCSITCMPYELSTLCDRNTGKCLFGCIDGYYGNMCKAKCISSCNDKTCDRLHGVCLNDGDFYNSEEVVKKIAIAVVTTCLITVLVMLAFQHAFVVVRSRLVRTETDRNEKGYERDNTGTYETLETERTNQMTYYDIVEDRSREKVVTQKKDTDYINTQKDTISHYANTNV